MTAPVDHVLLVDDDSEIRKLLRQYLERNGYRASAAPNARAMWRTLRECHIDLVVLDLMLPDEDGLEICRTLRASNTYGVPANIPIIILTARGDATDRIIGLEMGADDYLAKPFEQRELLARIKGVLRRVRALPPDDPERCRTRHLRFDRWLLDTVSRQLEATDGVITPLSSAEFRLLRVFLEHPQRVLNRDQIMELARLREGPLFDRSIDMTISRLRRRLGDDARSPRLLKTVWGMGYVFTAEVQPH